MKSYIGPYGGQYVPEMLIPALEELEAAYKKARRDNTFQRDFLYLLRTFSGRPTPLTYAENMTKALGGAKIYLKNEGLNITGAHKITHCIGHALLAKRTKKKRLIAETGAGQHGVATATIAAKLGFSCTVYMGEIDVARQRPNVFLMEQLGAEVIPVSFGNKTLKDAVNAALKDWIEHVEDSYYMLGSVVGPHPYPSMTRDFQSVVGEEVKKQLKKVEGTVPNVVIACVGGGSNAMGIFYPFLKDMRVQLIGVEAGGRGSGEGEHAMRFQGGRVGIIEGFKSYFLQDSDGQVQKTHSIAAGLDYPGVGPELSYLYDRKRIQFTSATDHEVIDAVKFLARTEGIIPALESAHAVAYARKMVPTLSKQDIVVLNISGRGDKDLFILAKALNDSSFQNFLKDQAERSKNDE